MSTMSVTTALSILESWGQDAASRALSAPDAFGAVAAHQRSQRYGAMVAAIRSALAETGAPPLIVVPATRKRAPVMMGALAFWALHAEAVQAIIGVYGLSWKCRAPMGETELVQVPSKWRSCIGERGTRLNWPRETRMPAARFWPAGVLPGALEITPDVARHTSETREHDPAWHRAHGYAWDGLKWVSALSLHAACAHQEGIVLEKEAKRVARLEVACLTYGPQPRPDGFRDIEDDLALSEAAD